MNWHGFPPIICQNFSMHEVRFIFLDSHAIIELSLSSRRDPTLAKVIDCRILLFSFATNARSVIPSPWWMTVWLGFSRRARSPVLCDLCAKKVKECSEIWTGGKRSQKVSKSLRLTPGESLTQELKEMGLIICFYSPHDKRDPFCIIHRHHHGSWACFGNS